MGMNNKDYVDELNKQEMSEVSGGESAAAAAAAGPLQVSTYICTKCGTIFKKASGVKMTVCGVAGCGGKVERIK